MSVTMSTFDKALKELYEGMVRAQLNLESGAFAMKVQQTERDIEGGRRVVKAVPYGVNGGTNTGTDTDALPVTGGQLYENFVSLVKELRGVIKFTNQVMEASKTSRAAFESAMTAEMQSLMKGAKFSYGRQFYMDGTGKLTLTGTTNPAATTVNVASTQYLIEGMIIDILDSNGDAVNNGTQRRIAAVDRVNNTIRLAGTATVATANTGFITEQGSYNKEITGMEAVYATSGTLYGLNKSNYPWLKPYVHSNTGALSDQKIIDVINYVEEYFGSKIDLITCNPAVHSEYYAYLEATKRSPNVLDLKGGYKALSINGVSMVKDRFVKPGVMKINDTTQWKIHTYSDWSWMNEDGKILKWVSGYSMWTAVLLKYAELICDHPGGQAELSGITTQSTLFS